MSRFSECAGLWGKGKFIRRRQLCVAQRGIYFFAVKPRDYFAELLCVLSNPPSRGKAPQKLSFRFKLNIEYVLL